MIPSIGGKVDQDFLCFAGVNFCYNWRGHKCDFLEEAIIELIAWVRDFNNTGYCGRPLDWR